MGDFSNDSAPTQAEGIDAELVQRQQRTTKDQVFPLLSLPDEILLALIDVTPYHAILALRLVSHAFHDLIPTAAVITAHERLAKHLHHLERTRSKLPCYLVELTLPYRDQFFHSTTSFDTLSITISSASLLLHLPKHRKTAPGPSLPRIVPLSTHSHIHPPVVPPSQIVCYICLLPLPPIQFAARHITDRRRPGGPQCHRRFCIDCAIHSGRWWPGTKMRHGPDEGRIPAMFIERIVCEVCGTLGMYHYSWNRDRGTQYAARRLCEFCLGRYGTTTLQHPLRSELNIVGADPMPVLQTRQLWPDAARYKTEAAKVGRSGEYFKLLQTRSAARVEKEVENEDDNGHEDEHVKDMTMQKLQSMKKTLESQMRVGRCQRCWAINHTERKVQADIDGRPLCSDCFNLALINMMAGASLSRS